MQEVFKADADGKLKGSKSKESLTQYHFFHFSKLQETDEKKILLAELAEGKISSEEFRERTFRPR